MSRGRKIEQKVYSETGYDQNGNIGQRRELELHHRQVYMSLPVGIIGK